MKDSKVYIDTQVIRHPKLSVGSIAKWFGLVIGLILMTVGFLLTITIVAGIVGIPIMLTGIILMQACISKVPVICGTCSQDNKVKFASKKFTCEYCGTVTRLKWQRR